jgi:hypothetical protein
MHPFSPQLHLVAVKGGTRELFSAFPSPTVGDKKNLSQPLYMPGNFHLALRFASLLVPCSRPVKKALVSLRCLDYLRKQHVVNQDECDGWGLPEKFRMTTLTREGVLNTFKYKVRAQRDCDSLCKLHKFQKV